MPFTTSLSENCMTDPSSPQPEKINLCNITPLPQADNTPCWGPKPEPRIEVHERVDYSTQFFVSTFLDTPAGAVPKVTTRPTFRDTIGTVLTRIGPTRNNYKVIPGLYAVGNPDAKSPVLVTANYKLSFDSLRFQMDNIDAWLIVTDTRGVNVWCAAGKGTFSTEEIILSVKECNLHKVVQHHTLIIPKVGATGVAGYQVKKECGFQPNAEVDCLKWVSPNKALKFLSYKDECAIIMKAINQSHD